MVAGRDQRRTLDPAAFDRMRATRMQVAAGRRIDRARHIAAAGWCGRAARADAAPGSRRARPAYRDGAAIANSSSVGAVSTMRPRYITATLIGDVLHHRKIVGDEHVGEAQPLLQIAQQVEDLRADRHIERRDRLVADDQLRLDRERARDHDALALPAGELVRIARGKARLAGRPCPAARATRSRRCAGGTMSMQRQRLGQHRRPPSCAD